MCGLTLLEIRVRLRRKFLSITILAMGIGLPLASPSAIEIGKDQLASVLAAMRDPMAILEGRSPGGRGGGAIQTKVAYAPVAVKGPSERVLSAGRPQPVGAPAAIPDAQLGKLIDDLIGPTVPGPGNPTLVTDPVPPGLGGGSSSSGGGFVPPPVIFGGSSGGSSGGEIPTPPISVPEPGSWMMLIAGVGFIGASLRRRRQRAFAA